MGWKDRLARLVARLFVTAPDHPGSGGVTGEAETDEQPSDAEAKPADEPAESTDDPDPDR